MRIFYRQIEIMYRYNPMGRYFNLWFFRHGKCVFSATLFKPEWFLDSVCDIGETLSWERGLQSHRSWIPDTHELIIEGSNSYVSDN